MPSQPPPPWELKVIARLFLLWGALVVWSNVLSWGPTGAFGEWQDHAWTLDPSALVVFPVAIGLWFRWPVSRFLGVYLSLYWAIGALLVLNDVFRINPDFHHSPPILPHIHPDLLRATVVPFCLIQFWQYFTLKRPHIKALFHPPVRAQLPGMPDAVPFSLRGPSNSELEGS